MTDPITHGPVSKIGYKLCKCNGCGTEQQCTPNFDFYVSKPGPDDGPLYCYPCLCSLHDLKPAACSVN